MTASKRSAAKPGRDGSTLATDGEIIDIALELATALQVRVDKVQIPSPRSAGEEPNEEWPKDDEAYWAVEAPRGKDPVTVLVDSNGSVRGVVPGDGVILEDPAGVPHAVGIVSQMSVREGRVRVLIERVRPIDSPS